MSILKNVNTIKCPICGCNEIVNESVKVVNYTGKSSVWEHCNGGRQETRKFLCGYQVTYQPNFKKEIRDKEYECENDEEFIARKQKEEDDKNRVLDILKKEDISENIIERIRTYF